MFKFGSQKPQSFERWVQIWVRRHLNLGPQNPKILKFVKNQKICQMLDIIALFQKLLEFLKSGESWVMAPQSFAKGPEDPQNHDLP